MPEGFIQAGDVRLHYYADDPSPERPPLVLLHGVLRGWRDYVPLLPALAPRWRCFALDFRGHGRSQRTPGRYLVTDYVADVVAFLRQELREPAVVYGHSLGAMVAAATAAAVPNLVRAAVLEDPPFHTTGDRIHTLALQNYFGKMQQLITPGRTTAEYFEQLQQLRYGPPGAEDSRALVDERDGASLRFSASCLAQVDRDVLTPVVAGQWLDGYDVQAVARGLRCPTLLLQGALPLGGMLTDDDAERVQRLAADCTLCRFPNSGHLLHWSDREEVLRLTWAFLESLRD